MYVTCWQYGSKSLIAFILQTDGAKTNAQKSLNVTRKGSVAASESDVSTVAGKQPAADRRLRSGRQTVPDSSQPAKNSVPAKVTASKLQ